MRSTPTTSIGWSTRSPGCRSRSGRERAVARSSTVVAVAAPLEPVLDVVRCPDCGASLQPDGTGAACAEGHRFDLIAGRAPDLARTVVQQDTPGQRAMRFRPLVAIYESVWRPLFTRLAGGTDPDAETDHLLGWLRPARGATVLDLACGPGNTTRRLAAGAGSDITVIGLDLSEPMLREAVERTPSDAAVGFARADAHALPVEDGTVDGVHCAAALYLFGDAGAVVGEVARVLRPGGRFAGMTLVAPLQPLGAVGRHAEQAFARLSGLRYFGADELEGMCTAAGLVRFRTTWRGGALLFVAERPSDG
jgi:SAM-dependent methyltransferase